MNKDIFISYSRQDQEFVARLATDISLHVLGKNHHPKMICSSIPNPTKLSQTGEFFCFLELPVKRLHVTIPLQGVPK